MTIRLRCGTQLPVTYSTPCSSSFHPSPRLQLEIKSVVGRTLRWTARPWDMYPRATCTSSHDRRQDQPFQPLSPLPHELGDRSQPSGSTKNLSPCETAGRLAGS